MRVLDELINNEDSGWPIVQDWIKSAKNKVEVLAVDTSKANKALLHTQVTTRSIMGAIVYHSGGLLIDNGWIRILGSGHEKLPRSLPSWNEGKLKNSLLIADDVIGGFFILNGGGLGSDLGKIYYLAPDNLTYEALDRGYSEFLEFCLNGDLEKFYDGLRWKNWRADVSKINGDQVFNFYPFLWTKEGKDINKSSKKVISVEEQYLFNMDAKKQLDTD
ncbi:DUF2625 domain-containing protein [Pedobacter frigoris]|uniref:DUF2625 domain-containing protein n=1 Tax=Pedobacter frigoris TaxID=2571272 RepID=A0A4U1CS57_9SPHI|nr:DUF2625 domain-containing protein [Pedobacter frigoris]TKC09760.1 DUF2625 domain-containing protein [Pedobacter frigoris]